MASRKMNLRKTSEKATSRITYKYFSVLVGYLLAIPLSPIGFTTISHIKQYQALKAQAKAKAMQEAKDKAKDEAEAKTEAKADAATQSPAKAETAAPANSEAEAQADTQPQADDTLQSSQANVAPDASTQSTTANSTEAQK